METAEEISALSLLLPLVGIVFIIAIGVVLLSQQFQKNLLRQKLQQEELKSAHQRELLRSSIQAQEEERKRIAQDMHDELGAILSMARMHLLRMQRTEGLPEGGKTFENINSLIESAMVNMRKICHELMPPQLDVFGLAEALEATVRQINNAGGIQIELDVDPAFREQEWIVNIGLYRINLELINNTLKHASADKIYIGLKSDSGKIISTYIDNGKGLPDDFKQKGIGFRGMEGRATSLGGLFESGNYPEGGFYAKVIIPYAEQHTPGSTISARA